MRVEVLVCNDGLEAKLSIRDFDSAAWRMQFPNKESLRGFLITKGLAPDRIEDGALDSIGPLLMETTSEGGQLAVILKEAQSFILASGIAPAHEEAEGLMFHKSYLSEPLEIENLVRSLQE